jgi:hypothetical protein
MNTTRRAHPASGLFSWLLQIPVQAERAFKLMTMRSCAARLAHGGDRQLGEEEHGYKLG